jgi:hypothetical protein
MPLATMRSTTTSLELFRNRSRAGMALRVLAASALVGACSSEAQTDTPNSEGPSTQATRHVLAGKPPVTFSITPSAAAGGTIAPSTVQTVASGQSSVAFVSTPIASPPNCFVVQGFALDTDGNGTFDSNTATNISSYNFTNVRSNKAIQALFAPGAAYGASASVDASGTGSGTIGSFPSSVCAGQNLTIPLSPAANSIVGDVKVNGVSVGAVNPVVVSNVQQAESVLVRFDLKPISAAVTPLRHDAQGALTYSFDDGLVYPDIVRLKGYMDTSVYTNPANPADTGSYNLPIAYCINTDDFLSLFPTPADLDAGFANLAAWATDSRNPIRVCSHTKTHPHLTLDIATVELGTAVRVLYNGVKAALTPDKWNAAEPAGMAYPFNDWTAVGIDTEILKYHVGGRVTDEFEINDSGDFYYAGEPTLLPGSPRYGSLHSCVWGVSRSCKNVSYPPAAAPSNNGNALAYVKVAIDNRKWMIFNFHHVEIGGQTSGTYGLLAQSQLNVFLGYAQQQVNAGNLFVDGIAEVAEYVKEAQNSTTSAPVVGSNTLTFSVTHNLASLPVKDENGNFLYTVEYEYPLTVKLQGADASWAAGTATQGGRTLGVAFVNGSVLVDGVIPNGGTVTLTK